MHIAIDARIINSSTGRYVERLLHHLEQIDHDNTYSVLVPSKDLAFWQPTNPNFTVRAADFANYSLAEQLGFKRYLDTLGADLVHFCMPQQPLRYTGKKVTTFHDLTLLKTYNSDKNWLIYHIKQLIGHYVFRRVAHDSDAIICPSNYTIQDLVTYTGVDTAKVTLAYEAAEVQVARTEPYNHPYKQFLLYVGQQSDYKNIRRLGDAHQQLLGTYPDLGLILVGRKKADSLANEAYFDKKGYKNITFTDFIPDEQRDYLYSTCAAYVFPSLMEGFGLPGLEAMAYRAPLVSSSATCLPEVYGDAAEYFDPTSVSDMARAIGEVLGNPARADELRNKGEAQLARYSWRHMAEQTHAVYRRVLERQ